MFKPLTPKTIEYVTTPNGTLRGFKQRDIYNFLGVQYGECKRWQTATPVQPWKGIKNAVQFGNRAFPSGKFTPWDSCGVAHEAYNYSEDCLNLNIWSPALGENAKKPVMVWIHGGGHATGSAMEMQAHDGENLARFGDVVVVTINHRLNLFGFCDMSQFGEKYANSGNCGMSDLVLALQWIQDNIACFGGDPGNVLIFGQSGGGYKVRSLMQIPAAEGLFHKVVVMSGSRIGPETEQNTSSLQFIDFVCEKIGTRSIEALEALEPEELLEMLAEMPPALDGFPRGMAWGPIKNDWYLGMAVKNGFTEFGKKIPVMIGSTYAEMPPIALENKHDLTQEQQIEIVRQTFPGQDADTLIKLFHETWPDRQIVDAALMADHGYHRQGDILFADLRDEQCSAPTYNYLLAYEFAWAGGRPAWHCADIPMVFHNSALYPPKFNTGVLDGLEDAVCASWVNFAHNGDPNNEYLGVHWPEYHKDARATMIFDKENTVRTDFDNELNDYYMTLKISRNFKQLIN